jgi:hypothetical protein
VATAHDFDEIATICKEVCDELDSQATAALASAWPRLQPPTERPQPSGNGCDAS